MSIHDRHDDIKEDQRYFFTALLQHGERRLSVFCFQNFIFRREDLTKHHPVDGIVLYH